MLAPRNGVYFSDPDTSFPEQQVVRSSSIELSRLGKRALRVGGGDIWPADISGGIRGVLRGLARRGLYFPDGQVGWYPGAVASGLRLLRHARFDAILSSSFPITAHLIARRLAQTARLPWVADFRDPWSEMLPPDDPARSRAARLERSLARDADAVVMTSPSWATVHARLWGRSVEVIPNGHQESIAPANPPDRFTLTYLGTFYPGAQRLDSVWDALVVLRRRGDLFVERIRVIGELNPRMRSELASRDLDDLLEVTGFLSHSEALRALEESSVLLVAGPVDAKGVLRGQVPAKLAEYLVTDLPILYVGDLDSDAADLLRRYPGCHLAANDDIAGAIEGLRLSHDGRVRREASSLSRAALTERLGAILDRVTTVDGSDGA